MAIEFNCPNCNAIIRVPDKAAGGRGRCPRCDTRIKVPKVSMPRVTKTDDVPEPEDFAPPDDDGVAADFPSAEPVEAISEPQSLDDMFAPRPTGLGELPVPAPRPAFRAASKFKRRQRGVPWQVPVALGLILCGGIGWYFWQQQQSPRLIGELTAETAAFLELEPVELSPSMFKRSSDEMKGLLEGLKRAPVPMRSALMSIQISASKKAVTVQVNAGTQTRFYRVDIQNAPALMKFRSEKGVELEEKRGAEIEFSAGEFLREYQRVLAKEAKKEVLNDFRDSLALPALVRGLGYQVMASTGQKTYRCVYEDSGALYFLMPPGIQEFEIIGRGDKEGKTLFPGIFSVIVAGEIAPSTNDKADKKSKNPSEMDEEKPGMSESSDDEMKKETDDGEMKMDEKPVKKKTIKLK